MRIGEACCPVRGHCWRRWRDIIDVLVEGVPWIDTNAAVACPLLACEEEELPHSANNQSGRDEHFEWEGDEKGNYGVEKATIGE